MDGIASRKHDIRALCRRLAAVAEGRWPLLGLVAVLSLAAVIRGYHVLAEGFPLNDGGLFYVMARDIQDATFGLPAHTSYNDAGLPFVYPPLGLYAAAAFDTLTPASLTAAFRVLPWAGTVFAAWACWRLALAVFRDHWTALAGALAFVLVPRSFAWLLMGGGLPRAWALGFALLAVAEAYRLAFDERVASYPRWRRVGMLGAFAGLTALTHLETAAFLALSCAVLLVLRPRRVFEYGAAAVLATAVAAPWGITVLVRHGLAPFRSSLDHGGRALSGGELSFDWIVDVLRDPVATGEPFFPIVGALGLAGAFVAVARGQWFLPLWWLVTFAVAMRAYPTFVSVPAALLAGMLVVQVLVPAIRDRWDSGALIPRSGVALAAGGAFLLALSGALERDAGQAVHLRGLDESERDAMAWVAANTGEDARFAIVPRDPWFSDEVSEWFPALAERRSIATPQGHEWLEGAFAQRERLHSALGRCGGKTYLCVRSALEGHEYTHLYVPAGCCGTLKSSLGSSSRYEVVYAADGVVIGVPASASAGE